MEWHNSKPATTRQRVFNKRTTNVIMENAQIDVVVEHLNFDVIDEHLRTSTAVLHDIMVPQAPEPSGEGDLDSTCKYCGKIYKSLSTLHRHLQLKHTNEEMRCSQCDKVYPSQLSLEQHVKYMHRRHRCAVCYKTFDSDTALVAHGEYCKKMETPCEYCGNTYASAVSMRNHVKYKHPAIKTHWCQLCRRAFTSDEHLLNHRYTVHPAGATTCACGKLFTSVSALQSHVLYRHTDVNARCHYCHKAFVTRSSLKRHLMKLHMIDFAACDVKEPVEPIRIKIATEKD